MKTVALISGGKDSCYNMLQCIAAGHEIVALANLHPPKEKRIVGSTSIQLDEMDSYMYQTVGHDAIDLYSEATELPLYREAILGTSLQLSADYTLNSQEDEVEDLYRLLARVKDAEAIEAVSVGAILSNYQRVRVENVCSRLGLTSLCYLWQRDQKELLEEMITSGMDAILIKVAALGLDPIKHLGKSIKDCQNELMKLEKMFGLNVCGEGGEYETLTLDCPLFKKAIVIEDMKIISHSKDPFAPVAYLKFPKLCLIDKEDNLNSSYKTIRKPEDFCCKELENGFDEILTETHDFESKHKKNVNVFSFPRSNQTDSGILFISGLVAESEAQMSGIMDTLASLIEKHGSTMNALVSVCLYIRDMTDYPRINSVYSQYFDLNPPVRVCVQAPITCYAMIEAVATSSFDSKRSLHVQSVSHWAPANIGPYSQCVEVGDLLMVSGQIGLIPGSMALPQPTNFVAECRLALRHTNRVLEAMDKDVSLKNSFQVVCFVREKIHIDRAKAIWEEYECGARQPIAFVVTSNLPRNALVEWQISACKSYEMITRQELPITASGSKEIGSMHITKCKDATALLCELDELPTNEEEWRLIYRRINECLGEIRAIKLFYKIGDPSYSWQILNYVVPEQTALTLVPVCELDVDKKALICCVN